MSTIFTLEKLYEAYRQCQQGKKNTINALEFELNREKNLLELLTDLKTRKYQIARHIYFVDTNTDTNQGNGTFENEGVGDRKFEYKRESAGEAKPSQTKWQEEILWLCRKIIFHDPTKNYIYRGDKAKQKLIPLYKSLFHGEVGKGLPIGNLTSQFFANVYLNQLDHYLTDTLQVKAFVRYVDDFVIVSVDRKKLRSYQQRINHFLEQELSLRLHPRKTELQAGQKGIDFLGYVIRPNYRLVRQKVVGRFKVAINTFKQTAKREQWPVATSEDSDVSALQQKFKHVVSSYHGHFSHAASYRLSVALKKQYEHLLGAQNHLG